MDKKNPNRLPFGHKKEGLSSRQPQSLLNLKSNTMKNTVQKYC